MNLALQLSEIEKQVSSLISENLDLKKENSRLKADYKSLYELREEENKGISKKIAELKEDSSEWEKASGKWKSVYELTNNQLTKAKEIIKKFLLWENDWHNKTESKYQLLKEAEQFLK